MSERILLVIFLIFTLAATIQIFYYLYFYLAVFLYKNKGKRIEGQPVSVIICARNEAENLAKHLPAVLEQDYASYEVIVVNDCSEDNTYDVLGKFIKQYPHLRISNITRDPKFTHNKKLAQFIGIKAAKNDILLFTDADCKPDSKKWIETMTRNFDEGTNYVLGYGGYMKQRGLLNAYIRYDTATIGMQYLGMALRKIPYMGVGRNLAYRRSVFFKNKGFGLHSHLVSGDDDLFINSNALAGDTRVEFSGEAHTRSVASASLNEWMTQKRRHLTTAPYYKGRDKFLLFAEPAARLIFYSSFIVLLSFNFYQTTVLSIIGARLLIQSIVMILVQKRLKESGLIIYSIVFDIFSPFINGFLYLGSKRKRPEWNRWR